MIEKRSFVVTCKQVPYNRIDYRPKEGCLTVEHIEQRYASHPDEVKRLDTAELRERFLVENLFENDRINGVYSHYDRVVMMGVSPLSKTLALPTYDELRADHFFDNREAGIVNIGGKGLVEVDGESFEMIKGACLYIGRGAKQVTFASVSSDDPAYFYLYSAPAHKDYPNAMVNPGEGVQRELGDQVTSNRRTLNQYIHQNGIQSCQVVMGVTQLHPGSMWNTMPAHTHARRMESYLYFDLPEDARVIHIMGEPQETRHMIVADKQATISPNWSVHTGVGTSAYSFIWAMAGENKLFDDMDTFPVTVMR